MQGSFQGNHYHLRFCVLPVDSTQPVDDALDSLENRRGQLTASYLQGGGRGGEKGEQEGFLLFTLAYLMQTVCSNSYMKLFCVHHNTHNVFQLISS